ncbi:MAG: tryptophan-rich sensory protein [Bacteroidales bacterium]|nr:tryptophan-rich sensory protein [Bacteroidales bacterium]
MYLRLIIFLVINFTALGIGSIFTGSGVPSEWYQSLNKAPWTPPGWVFGAAWTTIMICFSIFMAFAWRKTPNQNLFISLFVLQIILNVLWSLVFFKFHFTLAGIVIIIALTVSIGYFLFAYVHQLKLISLLVLPYFLWLIIATSLNMYILFKN